MNDLLSRNWENFLKIQAVGDWNGIWTRLAANGELVERFHGVGSYPELKDYKGKQFAFLKLKKCTIL